MQVITSKNNQLIRSVRKLLLSSKYRKEQKLFVIEGARSVFDVLNSSCEVKYFLITHEAYNKHISEANQMVKKSDESYLISENVTDALTDTQTPQGIFAVCKMQEYDIDYSSGGKYIILDNVRDPGNVGTIIRTAEAFGVKAVIAYGSCEIYNPKVLRSSTGSVFRIPIDCPNNLAPVVDKMKNAGVKIYGTSPDESLKTIGDVDFSGSCACVIGNEANGITDEVKKMCDELFTIPMFGKTESFNASTAAALVMWEMLRNE